MDVEYVHANVYDAVEALGGRRFDVVYTGKGALCYLPDLTAWAEVLRALLAPGGLLYLVEFHPLLHAFSPSPVTGPDEPLLLYQDYLEGRGAQEKDSPRTYTDGPPLAGPTLAYEWRHGLGEVLTALLRAGLRLETVREVDELPWPRWRRMTRTASGWWRLPEEEPRVPLLFAVRARRA